MKRHPLPKWLPHQQKCDITKCHKLALKENAVWTGTNYLFYCQTHFSQVCRDLEHPGQESYQHDPHHNYKYGQWPKPNQPTTKKRSPQWKALTKSLFNPKKQQRANNTRGKMPKWEQIQPKNKKKKKVEK